MLPAHARTTTPLRRRENESVVSSPHSAYDNHSYYEHTPFAAGPALLRRKKRRKHDVDAIVKWAMKGILLSPVLVLVLWSIGAVLFAGSKKNQQQHSAAVSGARGSSSSNHQHQKNSHHGKNNQQQKPQQHRRFFQMGSELVEVVGDARGEAAPPLPTDMMQNDGSSTSNYNDVQAARTYMHSGGLQQAQPWMAASSSLARPIVVQPPHRQAVQQNYQYVPIPQQQMTPPQQQYVLQQQQAPMYGSASSSSSSYQQQAAVYPPSGPLIQPLLANDLNVQPLPPVQQQQQRRNHQDSSKPVPIWVPLGAEEQEQPLPPAQASSSSSSASTTAAADSSSSSSSYLYNGQSPRVFYYDLSQTSRDQYGRMVLPQYVYDQYGQAWPLAQIQAKKMYLQEPVSPGKTTMIHHNITANNATTTFNWTYHHPNTISTPVMDKHHSGDDKEEQEQPSTSMQGTPKLFPVHWNNGNAHDNALHTNQSIIFGTVGLMALLVGALSARRQWRTRNGISSLLDLCMESEALHDEVAYDAAYTIHDERGFAQPGGGSSSYHTFGWNSRDLEKFDV